MGLADTFRKIVQAHPAPHASPAIDSRSPTWSGPFGGPGVPIQPTYPDAPARRYDYEFGVNLNIVPRTEYQGWIPSFHQLRTVYGLCSIIQVAMTYRVQQVLSNSWEVKLREGSASKTGVDKATALIQKPDPMMGWNFEAWLSAALQGVYTHDALTIVLKRNSLDRVIAFQITDGTTIKPLIDYDTGGFPAPPDAAFVQVIKGAPYTAYSSDDLSYHPFRPRDWCVYGESRVEKVLQAMMVYMLYESWTGDFFTQGNIPEVAYLTDPAQSDLTNWKNFRRWQKVLDMIAGANVSRRRTHLVPPFVKAVQELKKYSFDKELPDWFVRPLCIEFGIPAFLFVSETNRATAEQIQDALAEPSIAADLMSTKRLFDDLLETANMPEMEFNWKPRPDYSEARVKGVVLLCTPFQDGSRIMNINEGRGYLNLPALSDKELAEQTAATTQAQLTAGEGVDSPDGELPATETGDDAAGSDPADTGTAPQTANKSLPGPGRKPIGPRARQRNTLALQFSPVIAKRLRQKQDEIVRLAVEAAHRRGLKVNVRPKEGVA